MRVITESQLRRMVRRMISEAYKWRPSRTQAREFAQRMANDPEYKAEYEARKEARAQKRREGSRFDYSTAGGHYVPTENQARAAAKALNSLHLTPEEQSACEAVEAAFNMNEKTHHDNIHIVNELIRSHKIANF